MRIYSLEDASISPQPTGGKARTTDEFFEASLRRYLAETGRPLPQEVAEQGFRRLTGRGEHGKPYMRTEGLEDVHFSLSHTEGCAAIAFAGTPVGLDLVNTDVSRMGDEAKLEKIAKRFFTEEELYYMEGNEDKVRAFVTVWACREAYGKYTGEGLRTDFERVNPVALIGAESGAAIAVGKVAEQSGVVYAICADAAELRDMTFG
jgi:phosphopantetheinyl transferase